MKQFEEGKIYGAWDTGTPAIKIIKRTAKMCLVEDTITGNQWRMKIKEKNGYEELTDTGVPQSWRRCYTYSTMFEQEDDYTEDDYDSWKANIDLDRELYPPMPIEL